MHKFPDIFYFFLSNYTFNHLVYFGDSVDYTDVGDSGPIKYEVCLFPDSFQLVLSFPLNLLPKVSPPISVDLLLILRKRKFGPRLLAPYPLDLVQFILNVRVIVFGFLLLG